MEIWKQINDFPNYEISNLGNVRNKKSGRILKNKLNNYGYHYITLSKNNNQKHFRIHRLIALHFIENPNNYPTVDHIDRNKLNNNLNNLRWASHSQQIINQKHLNKGGCIIKTKYNTFRYFYYLNNKSYTKTFKSLFNAEIYRQMIKIIYLNK